MLVFNEENHTYTWKGIKIPSVTTVLGAVGIPDFSLIPRNTLEAACAFGTAVHKACELEDLNDLEWESLDSNLKPLVQNWRALQMPFLEGCEKYLCETKLFSEKYRFAGTLDRAYIYEGGKRLVVIDIKTGVTASAAGPQTAAYAELVCANNRIKPKNIERYTAHLIHGGTAKLEEHKDSTDWTVFNSALNIWNFKNKKR